MSDMKYKINIISICFVIGYLIFDVTNLLVGFFPAISIPDKIIGIICVGCFLFGFLYRLKNFNRYVSFLMAIMTLAIFISTFFYGNSSIIIDTLFVDSSLIIVAMFLFFSTEAQPRKRFDILKNISYLVIIINIVKLFTGGYYDSNEIFSYMGFGYSTSVYWCIILRFAFVDKKPLDIITSILVASLLIAFGNRGVIIIILVSLLAFIYLYMKLNKRIIILLITTLVLTLVLTFFNSFLDITMRVIEYTGLPSFSLERLKTSEFLISGRSTIWEVGWNLIRSQPWLGYGIGADRIYLGTHIHNIVLELFVNFGIIIGGILCFLLLRICIQMLAVRNNPVWRDLFLVYFLPSIVMLIFSSSLYASRDFWIALAIFCAYLHSLRKSKFTYESGVSE